MTHKMRTTAQEGDTTVASPLRALPTGKHATPLPATFLTILEPGCLGPDQTLLYPKLSSAPHASPLPIYFHTAGVEKRDQLGLGRWG